MRLKGHPTSTAHQPPAPPASVHVHVHAGCSATPSTGGSALQRLPFVRREACRAWGPYTYAFCAFLHAPGPVHPAQVGLLRLQRTLDRTIVGDALLGLR